MSLFASLLSLFLSSQASLAYFSFMDTGEVKKSGEYRVLGESQVLFDSPNGMNLNGRFGLGVTEESELQFEGGLGSIDYYLGAFWKWVPFPDTHDQPAIGLRTGLTFADVNDRSTYGLNITPFVSKLFETSSGNFSPFAGLQFGIQRNTADTFSALQMVLGLEWSPNSWDFPSLEGFRFLAEYGLEVDQSFDYLSFGASYHF